MSVHKQINLHLDSPKEISIFQRKHNRNQLENIMLSLIDLDNEEHDL